MQQAALTTLPFIPANESTGGKHRYYPSLRMNQCNTAQLTSPERPSTHQKPSITTKSPKNKTRTAVAFNLLQPIENILLRPHNVFDAHSLHLRLCLVVLLFQVRERAGLLYSLMSTTKESSRKSTRHTDGCGERRTKPSRNDKQKRSVRHCFMWRPK